MTTILLSLFVPFKLRTKMCFELTQAYRGVKNFVFISCTQLTTNFPTQVTDACGSCSTNSAS